MLSSTSTSLGHGPWHPHLMSVEVKEPGPCSKFNILEHLAGHECEAEGTSGCACGSVALCVLCCTPSAQCARRVHFLAGGTLLPPTSKGRGRMLSCSGLTAIEVVRLACTSPPSCRPPKGQGQPRRENESRRAQDTSCCQRNCSCTPRCRDAGRRSLHVYGWRWA